MMDFKAEARKVLKVMDKPWIADPIAKEAFIEAALRDAYMAGASAGLGQAHRLIRGEEAQPAELGLDP